MRRLWTMIPVALLLLLATGLVAGCGNSGTTNDKTTPAEIKGPALLFFTMDG